MTAERDIVVESTLWDQHDFVGSRWDDHPWNPVNNDTLPEDALPATGGDHWQDRIAFFRTVEGNNDAVLTHQERFVDEVLSHIRSVRMIEETVDLCGLTPRQDLLVDATPNEAYCVAAPGDSYVVYFPTGGEVTLRLEDESYRLRYLDTETATWATDETGDAGTEIPLNPPQQRNPVAVLTAIS